ncbi:MAG: glycosyl hydrolase, partial [Armatimonadota bacterium]
VTPRQGLDVPYLSSEYWERFHLALNEARERGMLVGIMDDFPYPSGMAGGRATWANPAFIRTELRCDSFEVEGPQFLRRLLGSGEVIRAWAWPVVDAETDWSRTVELRTRIGVAHTRGGLSWGQSLTDYSYARFGDHEPQNELAWDVPRGRWRVMIFTVDRCRSFKYYGEFLDTLNPDAVANFLRITLGEHETGLGRPLGERIRSVFTDETQGGSWTVDLPRIFRERCGYDLRNHLPALVDDSFPEAARVRYDYLSTLHDRFMSAYHRQYAAECEARGLLYTTEVPMLRSGDEAAAHIPGVDHAHERIGEDLAHGWLARGLTHPRHWPRFKSSVAAQQGKPRVAVEAFHSLGWGVRLADLKALIDRMAALGVNLFAPHGFYYTAAGPAKFDAAPSEFYQHPWWRHFRRLADYAGRLSWIASRGRDVAPIALLDPVTSLWTNGGDWWGVLRRLGADARRAGRISDDWAALIEALNTHQRPHHTLDPADLAEAEVDGAELFVGHARYQALVVPPVTNLETDAFARLRQFAEAGGLVLWVGPPPAEQIEAGVDIARQAAELPESVRFIDAPGGVRESGADRLLLDALDEALPPLLALDTHARRHDHVLAHVREVEGRRIVLLANCSQEELSATARLHTDAASAERWDAETGERSALPCRREADRLACEVTLPAHGSIIIATGDAATSAPTPAARREIAVDLTEPWRVAETPRNILRLGRFEFALEDRACAEGVPPEPIINTLARISDREALPVRVSPGGMHPTGWSIEYPLTVAWCAEFRAECVADDLMLVVDRDGLAGDARVLLNGTELALEDAQPHFIFEHSNVGWPVANLVEEGLNELLIEIGVYADDDGLLDAAWLTGSFGVAGTPGEMRRLIAPPQSVEPLDLPDAGLPHFAGTLALERTIALTAAPTHLALDGGTERFLDCAEVFLGDRSLGVRCWPPFRWNVPEDLRGAGEAKLRVEITTSAGPAIEGKKFDMDTGEYVEL